MLNGTADVLTAAASFLVGLTGFIAAVSARRSARAARASAAQALQASPAAIEVGMRKEIDNLIQAYDASQQRNAQERDGMESALDHERRRAEKAEAQAFHLEARLAVLHLDLAAARAEISQLGTRLDDFVNTR